MGEGTGWGPCSARWPRGSGHNVERCQNELNFTQTVPVNNTTTPSYLLACSLYSVCSTKSEALRGKYCSKQANRDKLYRQLSSWMGQQGKEVDVVRSVSFLFAQVTVVK